MTRATPCVIVLNGVGSSGKTSTARALQQVALHPFLLVSMDDFIGMMPPRLFGHEDGMVFDVTEREGHRVIDVRSGALMKKLMKGMRAAIAALVSEGHHLIVDDVMFHPDEAATYRRLLAEADLRLVGLFAPLRVLEMREKARGDREIGLARGQYGIVHQGVEYDLELDTSTLTPVQCAEAICKTFSLDKFQ